MNKVEELTNRFVEFVSSTKKSIRRMSLELGMNQRTLDRIVKKEIKVSADALTSILEAYPELSAEWLMRGKGPMLSNSASDDDFAALAGVVSDLTETLKEKNKIIAMLNKQIDESKNN